ncbi:DUF1302 domain-containing protein [Massilia niabensis]|uniref:DUF1302 domain-containing protein n=1 Tax=Massilia niabensis TaxID=544910 RepID=A0ABW0LCI6_9BURK
MRHVSAKKVTVKNTLAQAIMLCFIVPAPAYAIEIKTGNPDLSIRWDNSIRYNLGFRTKDPDSAIANTPGMSNSTLKFDKGDVITNRLDLLSEFDVVYKEDFGFRLSAQAWNDSAYDRREKVGTIAAYPNARYTDYTTRWNRGPSGELLDVFVFGKFTVGSVTTNVKAGQHNLYWGESLFTPIHGVSYSQGPVDTRKSQATPGIEAKELFKPLNQISFTTQLSDTLAISGQYLLDWRGSPLADGGTYWGNYDWLTMGGGTVIGGALPFVGTIAKPRDDRGDWGLMARWSPAAAKGTLGFYYREYTDKFPVFALAQDFSSLGLDYSAKRTTLTGISYATQIAGISVGSELVHRKNTALLATGATTVGNAPIGDTWHALVNVLGYAGETPLFDSMAWMGEVTYSRLDKVRANSQNYNSVDFACSGLPNQLACATKDSWTLSAKVEPKWTQALNGVDLSVPIFFTKTLKGTAPVFFGGYEGNGSVSLGVTAEYNNAHTFSLVFAHYMDKKTIRNNMVLDSTSNLWDRDNVTFTYKTSF